MNRLFMAFVALMVTFILKADDYADSYIESFNEIADDYADDIQDIQVIRNINGGTVIIPVFDKSCPEMIKAPFTYACKIVEEYIPPCLP